jgi:hypothetical protein
MTGAGTRAPHDRSTRRPPLLSATVPPINLPAPVKRSASMIIPAVRAYKADTERPDKLHAEGRAGLTGNGYQTGRVTERYAQAVRLSPSPTTCPRGRDRRPQPAYFRDSSGLRFNRHPVELPPLATLRFNRKVCSSTGAAFKYTKLTGLNRALAHVRLTVFLGVTIRHDGTSTVGFCLRVF